MGLTWGKDTVSHSRFHGLVRVASCRSWITRAHSRWCHWDRPMEGTGLSQCIMGGIQKVASEILLHLRVRDAFMGRGQSRETQQMYQCGEWLATARSSMKSILMRNIAHRAMSWTFSWSVLTGSDWDPERTGSGWDHCHKRVEAGWVSMALPIPSHLHRAGLGFHIGCWYQFTWRTIESDGLKW